MEYNQIGKILNKNNFRRIAPYFMAAIGVTGAVIATEATAGHNVVVDKKVIVDRTVDRTVDKIIYAPSIKKVSGKTTVTQEVLNNVSCGNITAEGNVVTIPSTKYTYGAQLVKKVEVNDITLCDDGTVAVPTTVKVPETVTLTKRGANFMPIFTHSSNVDVSVNAPSSLFVQPMSQPNVTAESTPLKYGEPSEIRYAKLLDSLESGRGYLRNEPTNNAKLAGSHNSSKIIAMDGHIAIEGMVVSKLDTDLEMAAGYMPSVSVALDGLKGQIATDLETVYPKTKSPNVNIAQDDTTQALNETIALDADTLKLFQVHFTETKAGVPEQIAIERGSNIRSVVEDPSDILTQYQINLINTELESAGYN